MQILLQREGAGQLLLIIPLRDIFFLPEPPFFAFLFPLGTRVALVCPFGPWAPLIYVRKGPSFFFFFFLNSFFFFIIVVYFLKFNFFYVKISFPDSANSRTFSQFSFSQ